MLDGAEWPAETSLPEGEQAATEVADFSLLDVNPHSATYNRPVSPRDFLGEVSAWYFGHPT
jgi:hypothetical protein